MKSSNTTTPASSATNAGRAEKATNMASYFKVPTSNLSAKSSVKTVQTQVPTALPKPGLWNYLFGSEMAHFKFLAPSEKAMAQEHVAMPTSTATQDAEPNFEDDANYLPLYP
jgi:hypothetical protein